ncbi:MAG: sugar ABC transporter permease [Acetivibrionales bacterium]|jgi:putative multiple sugar transport system permease protein
MTQSKVSKNQSEGLLNELLHLIKKNIREYGMYIALVVIIAIFAILTKGVFISPRNISTLLNQTGYIIVLAIGMTLIIVCKYIDLSVGFTAGFLGAVSAIFMTKHGISEWIVIPIILFFGLMIGLYNGFMVGKLNIPAYVVSLAGMFIFRGLLLMVTQETGTIIVPNKGFNAIGNGFIPDIIDDSKIHILTLIIGAVGILLFILGAIRDRNNKIKYEFEVLSTPLFIIKLIFTSLIIGYISWIIAGYNGLSWTVVICLIVVIIYDFVTQKTSLGRHIYAVGGNGNAAELAGISVKKITYIIFASMGMLSALSGILFTSRLQSATTTAGTLFELDAIASAFVGGASAGGGVGKVTGSVVGALVMMSLTSGMNLMGWDISYQYVIRGAVLVLAVFFDVTTRRKRG